MTEADKRNALWHLQAAARLLGLELVGQRLDGRLPTEPTHLLVEIWDENGFNAGAEFYHLHQNERDVTSWRNRPGREDRVGLLRRQRISGPEVEFDEATKRELREGLDDIRRTQIASPE